MKKRIITAATTIMMAVAIFSSCQSSTTKTENARDKQQAAKDQLEEANQELNQALKDSIQQYMKESEIQIVAYEKSIAELRAKIAGVKKENKANYEMMLAELDQKHIDLKKKLKDYKETGQDNWISFKREFEHDMDGLAQAYKDLSVYNTK